jgi:hypothetical protein
MSPSGSTSTMLRQKIDYPEWEVIMRSGLQSKGVWGYVNGIFPRPNAADADKVMRYEMGRAKACSKIMKKLDFKTLSVRLEGVDLGSS